MKYIKFVPILFSTEMVKAILNGTKKQTRRIIKPYPNFDSAWKNKGGFNFPDIDCSGDLLGVSIPDKSGFKGVGCCVPNVKVKAHKDDIFWVRETWNLIPFTHHQNYHGYAYKADWEEEKFKWKPSIFMPKEACRIFLKVTKVRVERLNDITEEDAVMEGVENFWQDDSGNVNAYRNYLVTKKELEKDHWAHVAEDARDSFKTLWESINGLSSWDKNPYVWVYDFELIDKPENFNN